MRLAAQCGPAPTLPEFQMPGRDPIPEPSFVGTQFDGHRHRQRRAVLRDTLARLEGDGRARMHDLARRNLARWAEGARGRGAAPGLRVRVIASDWGEATLRATMATGICHAALNMANAWLPGGRYIEGTGAQEENLFRRTDCHFTIDDTVRDPRTDRYHPTITALLNAEGGRVMLDASRPRVCIRGPEDSARQDLGYALLPEDEVFPFHELRAAAINCARQRFDKDEAGRRVKAQLDTLRDAGLTHAILSAFGCGAFMNPPEIVSRLYRTELEKDDRGLREVTFAIFDPGWETGNFKAFEEAFSGFGVA